MGLMESGEWKVAYEMKNTNQGNNNKNASTKEERSERAVEIAVRLAIKLNKEAIRELEKH